MAEIDRAHSERVLTALLLTSLVLSGVVLMREGLHYDNTIGGERLFMIALFAGASAGFLAWTRYTGITPALSLSGPSRQLWLATIVAGLVSAAAASYVNRTLATLTERSTVVAIDSIQEGKGTRWYVVVSTAEGGRERYPITEPTAIQLKNAKAVRMRFARGALGFDYIAAFEPIRQ